MGAYHVSPLELQHAVKASNLSMTAGDFRSKDNLIEVEVGQSVDDARQLRELVVGVFDGRQVFLKDVEDMEDGPEEISSYFRYGRGPAKEFTKDKFFPGTSLGGKSVESAEILENNISYPAVTIAIAKKKGDNGVWVAHAVLKKAEHLKESIVAQNMDLIITRY